MTHLMASPLEKAQELNSHETNRLTLRFKHSLAEDGFLRSQGKQLYRGAFIVLILAVIVAVSILISVYVRSSSTYSDSQRNLNKLQLYACAALIFVLALAMVVCGIFARCTFGYRSAGLRFMEIFLVVVFIICLFFVVLTDRFYLTEILLHTNPYTIWPQNYFSDSRILLGLVCIVVETHLAMPVRWFVLVYLDIATVLVYFLLCTVIGSIEATLQQINIPLLVLIVLSLSLGKRASERGDRRSFALIAQERVLRVESQFQLSSYKQEHTHNIDEDLASGSMVRSSAPSTAATERVFTSTNIPNAVKFKEIELLGLREGWLINFSDLEVTRIPSKVLGSGSFGVVIEGKYNGALVAIKLPKEEEVTEMTEAELRTQFNELRILRHLRHPNIVMFYGAAIVESRAGNRQSESRPIGYLALVLERLHGMSLDAFVKQSDQHPRYAGMHYSILIGACSALRYLHALNPQVVHGDLKPSNIWVTIGEGRPCAKLLDYGLSRAVTKRAPPLGGSLMWLAPEIFHSVAPRTDCDAFSFGRVMFFVVTGVLPLTPDQLRSLMDSHQLPPLQWPVGKEFPELIKETIEECSNVNPRARPSISEVYDVLIKLSEFDGVAPLSARLDMPQKRDRGDASDAIPSSRIDRYHKVGCSELEQNVLFGESTRKLNSVPEEPEGLGDLYSLEDSGTRKLYDSFHLTPLRYLKLTIFEAILRWNIAMPRGSCCRLHCVLDTLRRITAELEQSECSLLVPTHQILVQCKFCLLLDLVDAQKAQRGLFQVCRACANEDSHDASDDTIPI